MDRDGTGEIIIGNEKDKDKKSIQPPHPGEPAVFTDYKGNGQFLRVIFTRIYFFFLLHIL
jgi:hypothetical protein